MELDAGDSVVLASNSIYVVGEVVCVMDLVDIVNAVGSV